MNKEEMKGQNKADQGNTGGNGGNTGSQGKLGQGNNNGGDPTKKDVIIIVNGTPFPVEKDEISYSAVVALAFSDAPRHPERTYSVTYKRGHGEKPEGILSPGGTVKVKNEMLFNVKHTGQS